MLHSGFPKKLNLEIVRILENMDDICGIFGGGHPKWRQECHFLTVPDYALLHMSENVY